MDSSHLLGMTILGAVKESGVTFVIATGRYRIAAVEARS
jgi:hypothetical protein